MVNKLIINELRPVKGGKLLWMINTRQQLILAQHHLESLKLALEGAALSGHPEYIPEIEKEIKNIEEQIWEYRVRNAEKFT